METGALIAERPVAIPATPVGRGDAPAIDAGVVVVKHRRCPRLVCVEGKRARHWGLIATSGARAGPVASAGQPRSSDHRRGDGAVVSGDGTLTSGVLAIQGSERQIRRDDRVFLSATAKSWAARAS
jgi:hypothetical protein